MHHKLYAVLDALSWNEEETPPVVDLSLFFDGNTEEESIAPNQWGDGRPSIAELYARFLDISQRSDVERVLVGLHSDWNDPMFRDSFPPAENVHIFSSATTKEVESWLSGMHCDGVIKGWPYGKPRNAPEPTKGYTVYSVCWD